jgi:hypothetical protein
MSDQTEVNPLRDQMVRNVIGQHAGEPITVENLAPHFPPDFDLGQDDLAPYQEVEFEGGPAEVKADPTPEPDSKALADARDAKTPVSPQPRTPKEAQALAEAIEAATLRRIKSDQNLANRRVELLAAQSAERDARTKLAEAVTTFQKGFAPVTPEQLRRAHVQEQAEIRAAIKDGRLSPRKNPGSGKSVVDRMASYGRGGNPARGDYRRGAYPSQAKGAPNYDPRRGPVAKLPSEL